MNEQYVFDTDTLVKHVIYKLEEPSPLRIQKTIYFLFAFYASGLGLKSPNKPYLFSEKFEAWAFGPVLRSVYTNAQNGDVEGIEWVPETKEDMSLYMFIDEVIASVNKLGDFQLVERTHQDNAWKNAYIECEPSHAIGIMNREDIRNDYIK